LPLECGIQLSGITKRYIVIGALSLLICLPIDGVTFYQNSYTVDFYRVGHLAGEDPLTTKNLYIVCRSVQRDTDFGLQLIIALDDYTVENQTILCEPVTRSDIYVYFESNGEIRTTNLYKAMDIYMR